MKRHPKGILTILITLLLAASILTVPILRAADHVRIIRIADGDTIVVNFKGNNEKVRFLCVNIPESFHPDRKQNLPKGKIASDYTKYDLSHRYDEEYREAERHARNQKLGIWSDPNLTKKYLMLKSKWGQYRSQTSAQPKEWNSRQEAIRSERIVGTLCIERASPPRYVC